MKKPSFSVLICILTVFLFVGAGCVNKNNKPTVNNNPTEEETPNVSTNSVVEANNQFAFELYSKYQSKEGNVFFSPYSISTALAMTYEGARDKTAEEMQSVFHWPTDSNIRQSAFLSIYNELNKQDKKYQLNTANALWAQKDYLFLKDYLDVTGKYYGAEVTNLDFINQAEPSRVIINNWVEKQTNDKIKDLMPKGAINDLTRLVLTNAIYFKGTWLKQFNKTLTQNEDFKIDSNTTVKAPTMSLTGEGAKFNYMENDQLQLLELPYDGKELSMLILLSKKDDLKSLEKLFNSQNLSEWKSALQEERVDVYLPKFKFDTKYFMANDLAEMGMPTAFTNSADFSGMTGNKDLFISTVIHQAFVEMNEEGTEAAAATGVGMMTTSVPISKVNIFRADHPFLFLIQDNTNGNILFLGRMVNP